MSWWKYAKPGDKVVCVDDRTAWPIKLIEKGCVYTVNEIAVVTGITGRGKIQTALCVRLNEAMFNPCDASQFWVNPEKFRPVKSTDNSMKLLHGILNGQPVKENA